MNRSSLQALCNRTGFRAFFSYFERNWNTCKEICDYRYINAAAKVKTFVYDTTTIGCVIVSDKNSSHTVSLDNYECTFSFASTMKLPCEHAIAYLKTLNSKGCIPFARIHSRWNKGNDNVPVRQQIMFRPLFLQI
ncbi:hypothetical protein PR002_g19649 [Phytophthora rubi]|uniref:SWIM-type domain-containing protein n=1 Tax=Phytophthora rubi TaxID=129364 RepID=A0A6A3JPC0_9STRA|nr:hypothetical protein PR002_g19649 [Phytophthora rubi]